MPNMQLAKNLYTLRLSRGLTQYELGNYLHISRQAYTNYENMKRNPDLETLISLASLYNVSLDELVHHNIKNPIDQDNRVRNAALDRATANMLYLTSEETSLVILFRTMGKEKRSSLKNFVHSLFSNNSTT